LVLNIAAIELNKVILSNNLAVFDLLSEKGKGMYYPSKGIPAQSAEAKGKEIDATIGMAIDENSSPLVLELIAKEVSLSKKDIFNYSSSFGNNELREVWKKMIFKKNPSLNSEISLPIVTGALTHGLNLCAFLFVNENDSIIMPNLYWGNYKLIFSNWFGGKINTFEMFKGNEFNLDGLKEKLDSISGKKIVLLNFPNNPTGYSLTLSEADKIVELLKEDAEKGNKLLVLVDDAYFGLVYKEGIFKESLFSKLSNLHENLLAVKIDGPTKEDFVWGFRIGFLTFGIKNGSKEFYSALESKVAGAIRASVSNLSTISQSLLLKAYSSKDYASQKQENFSLLKKRFEEVNKVLENKKYLEYFEVLPYNSGYFMCIKPKKPLESEKLRKILLQEYSTGVISQGDLLRIAFSATKTSSIEKLFDNIYNACKSEMHSIK